MGENDGNALAPTPDDLAEGVARMATWSEMVWREGHSTDGGRSAGRAWMYDDDRVRMTLPYDRGKVSFSNKKAQRS